MMRVSWLLILCLMAGCSEQQPSRAPAPSATAQPSAPATDQPPTAAALDAQKVAQSYLDLLHQRRYAEALKLWGSDGAANGGVAAFAKSQRIYKSFEGRATKPSPIHVTNGEEFILVEVEAHAVLASGKPSDSNGVVMLKRPATGQSAAPQSATSWHIWGVDLRRRHCRPSEKAAALGCVAA